MEKNYESAQVMAEILHEGFKSVFTKETVLVPPKDGKQVKVVENMQMKKRY